MDLVFLSGNKLSSKTKEDDSPEDTKEDNLVIQNPGRITNPHMDDDLKPAIFNVPQHTEFRSKDKFLPIHVTEDTLKKRIREAERRLVEQREQEKEYLYRQARETYEDDHDEDTCARINCRDISKHIMICPVCSSLYKADRTVFYIFIIALVLVIAFLLRKLNNKLY